MKFPEENAAPQRESSLCCVLLDRVLLSEKMFNSIVY